MQINMDTLNPYAQGEWLQLYKKPKESDESDDQCPPVSCDKDTVAEEEDLSESYRILRGPCWNYGQICDNYYSNLLFGKRKNKFMTHGDLVLKGREWTPSKRLNVSFSEYIFRRLKRADPETTALLEVETGRSVKYKDVIEMAESLACGLRRVGVLPGHVIVVISHNSIEAQLMILASLLVGSVAALVDSGENTVDLGINLRIANPRLIFCESGKTLLKLETSLSYLSEQRPPKVVVNTRKLLPPSWRSNHMTFQQLMTEVEPDFQPALRYANPENPVFILYTSGTTASPKGALISERFFMKSKAFLDSVFLLPGSMKYSLLTTLPIHWVSVILAFFIHLCNGHRIVFFRGHPPEAALIKALQKHKVTVWVTGPSTLMYLLYWPAKPNAPSLKGILATGMHFSAESMVKVMKGVFDGKVPIFQIYGLTEVGTMTGNTPEANKIGSVGKVFYNVEMKVVDNESGLPLGPNQVGELCFKSESMMLRYFNSPVSTEEVFSEDGFFHTGDLGYYDDEGFVFFEGRIKDLIKWRAYQITAAEVEAQLVIQPEVKEAVVFALPDEKDGELVTAAVVLKEGYQGADPAPILKTANDRLSESRKIRGGLHVFSTLMRTATGKPIKSAIVRQVLHRIHNALETIH